MPPRSHFTWISAQAPRPLSKAGPDNSVVRGFEAAVSFFAQATGANANLTPEFVRNHHFLLQGLSSGAANNVISGVSPPPQGQVTTFNNLDGSAGTPNEGQRPLCQDEDSPSGRLLRRREAHSLDQIERTRADASGPGELIRGGASHTEDDDTHGRESEAPFEPAEDDNVSEGEASSHASDDDINMFLQAQCVTSL